MLAGWEPKAESALKDLAVVLKQQGRAADAAALITHYRPQVDTRPPASNPNLRRVALPCTTQCALRCARDPVACELHGLVTRGSSLIRAPVGLGPCLSLAGALVQCKEAVHESLDNMLLDIYKALRCYPEQARAPRSLSLGEAALEVGVRVVLVKRMVLGTWGHSCVCSLEVQLSVSHRGAASGD